ncbi:hypothetical protein B6V72_00160 [Thioclava sp. F34-6]|uniref:phosphoadenosine phosphosulfate reductase n=1 Tax=Thioclava sp. F34-6 TaxID=1973003 RepID=UPI000B53CABD|nr:phosphoadenosine phosphosulfate reductase [Thioclava sp. F34-6]OWY15056.1 hypothetical protein B6V72_00160 [Thioclava sp. F34-6]
MPDTALKDRQIAWTGQLERIGADHGFYRRLDAEHKALFVEGDDTLVVTFDNLDDARQKVEERLPWGVNFINSQGWSALGIGAHGWTWYRAEAVYDFFDEMRETGFFERFRRVVFYGTSMAGYAAAAFSSAAPGATVLALSPQATLDRDVTGGWEGRYRAVWRRNFTDRYGYAPDEAAQAAQMWLLYDPTVREDSMHATLFRAPNVTRIRCRRFGHRLGSSLTAMGVLKPITQRVVAGDATPAEIYALLRARRSVPAYQKTLLKQLLAMKRPRLTYDYAHAVLRSSHPARRPHYRKAMDEIAKQFDWPSYTPPAV